MKKVIDIIGLSFNDKSTKTFHKDNKTTVYLNSYFRLDRLGMYMGNLGYDTLPDCVFNALQSCGYSWDYHLKGWTVTTVGVATCDSRDTNDEKKGDRIAFEKAKVNAYKKANRCFEKIINNLMDTLKTFKESKEVMDKYVKEETEALGRVIETGYCNPNKK